MGIVSTNRFTVGGCIPCHMGIVSVTALSCIALPLVLLARNHHVRFPLYLIWAVSAMMDFTLAAGWV